LAETQLDNEQRELSEAIRTSARTLLDNVLNPDTKVGRASSLWIQENQLCSVRPQVDEKSVRLDETKLNGLAKIGEGLGFAREPIEGFVADGKRLTDGLSNTAAEKGLRRCS